MRRPCKVLPVLIGMLLAGCGDDAISTPDVLDPPTGQTPLEGFICESIDFSGFEHGDQIPSVTAFGLTFPVTVVPFGPTSQPTAYAYDADHVGGPDFDLEWNGPSARCPECEGLGRMIVVGSSLGFPQEGDGEHGGAIAFITGFAGGDYYVESFKAVDNEASEPPMELFLDGVSVAQSSQQGDGSVETVTTLKQTFHEYLALTAGTAEAGDVLGSGAFDDIVLCKRVPPPPPPPPCPAGSFTYSLNAAGDLVIVYDQFPAPNDNSYGANAVGWGSKGHTFGNLTGSDHAGFQLVDGGGIVRLSFNVDYLSANPSAPSGYASLGVVGGDGKMIVGTASGISATTSLANNLNNVNIPGLFTAAHVQQFGSVNVLVDSPPTDAAHTTYVVSDPALAGWDFHNTYYVTISAAKLASLGFDPATWRATPNADQLHNSPAKPCPPAGGGALSVTKTEVRDREVKVTVRNGTSGQVVLTDLVLTWPTVNGKLTQFKFDGDVVYDNPDISGGSAHLTTAEMATDPKKRRIDPGKSRVVTFKFEKTIDTNLANYAATLAFGDVAITVLP